jgi:hypothetical protein
LADGVVLVVETDGIIDEAAAVRELEGDGGGGVVLLVVLLLLLLLPLL